MLMRAWRLLAVARFCMGNCSCYPFVRVSPNWCFSCTAGRCTPSCSRCIAAGRSSAADTRRTVQITNAGHIVTWQYDGMTLTEVAASAQHPLPQRRRLMSHRLKGTCTDELECRGGVTYHVEFSLEPVERETFWTYQKELTQTGDPRRAVALLRIERPVRAGSDELHQSRIARSQPEGAGVSHVSG